MRYALVTASMLVVACFGEAPMGPATAGDSTSAGTGTTAMTAADSSTTSTVDTTATSSTVESSDDAGPTSGGPDCEMGTVPTPPKPPGAWGGPGYMMVGDEVPTVCPDPLGTGPRALLGEVSANMCTCRCEGGLLDICEYSFASGSNCTSGLGSGGFFETECANLPGPATAANVNLVDSACTPVASPPPGEAIQLCPAERDMAECSPVRDDMRGPCFWSLQGEACPDELDTVMAQVPTCEECFPCDPEAYCSAREWTPYDAPNCDGDPVIATVTDANCHLNFPSDALSIRVAPGAEPPACTPSPLSLSPVTVCCIPE